jgi:hypothetical protein
MTMNDLTHAEWATLLQRQIETQPNAVHDQKPNAHERSGTEIERRIRRELQTNAIPFLVKAIAKRVFKQLQQQKKEFATEHQKLRDEIELLRKDISGATPTSPTVVSLKNMLKRVAE